MRNFFSALATSLALATPVVADGPVVVELYTSQGCSSCPPADEILHQLAARPDVIALALHVDYWDYIGWADSFASPDYTRRQQNYARVANASTIYTPQMVIAGQDHVIGTKPMEVADLIRDQSDLSNGVNVSVTRSGNRIVIAGQAQGGFNRAAMIQVIRYSPEETVDIRRGENAGRQLSYANIVTDLSVVGEWDGRSDLNMTVNAGGNAPVVVIIQEPGPGAILAAAQLR